MQSTFDYVPCRNEISRRIKAGVTPREAELWLAAELGRAAELLRKDDGESTKANALRFAEHMKGVIDTVVNAVR